MALARTIAFGGIAVCFKRGLFVEALDVDKPDYLELMLFQTVDPQS